VAVFAAVWRFVCGWSHSMTEDFFVLWR